MPCSFFHVRRHTVWPSNVHSTLELSDSLAFQRSRMVCRTSLRVRMTKSRDCVDLKGWKIKIILDNATQDKNVNHEPFHHGTAWSLSSLCIARKDFLYSSKGWNLSPVNRDIQSLRLHLHRLPRRALRSCAESCCALSISGGRGPELRFRFLGWWIGKGTSGMRGPSSSLSERACTSPTGIQPGSRLSKHPSSAESKSSISWLTSQDSIKPACENFKMAFAATCGLLLEEIRKGNVYFLLRCGFYLK